ncbi:MAG: glutathione S-transferase N-terminal domain-containing protein [Pseudomonadota bacterium]
MPQKRKKAVVVGVGPIEGLGLGVPILVLGDRETLIDSSIIADYLEE